MPDPPEPTPSQPAWNDFNSSWRYPPPLDHDFIVQTVNYSMTHNMTTDGTSMILPAIRDLPRVTDPHSFGQEQVVVHVGDVLETAWTGEDSRTIFLTCIMCSEGVKDGQGVFEACDGYNATSHVSTFVQYQASRSIGSSPYTLPPLSSSFKLPDQAVGICIFSLSSNNKGFGSIDFTIPFPVAQAPRASRSHFRFELSWPTGTIDSSIPDSTPSPTTSTSLKNDKVDVGAAVGGSIGGLAALALIGVVAWILWRKVARKKKIADQYAQREIELETRRVEDEDPEPPPAYHEVVRAKLETDP